MGYSYLGKKIIFIMTDTQRTDMLGCYGNQSMHTPCIDQLAAEATRFERAYTCQPVCGPARSSIFTGTYPHSNGSWTNSQALAANVKTIGQRLRDYRMHTAYIGKYHLDGGDYFGLGQAADGWDSRYWYDMRNYLDEFDEEKRFKSRQLSTMQTDEVKAEDTYAYRVTDRAIRFLHDAQAEDYFLVVSYDEPHDPCLCPEPYQSMYKDYAFPKSRNIWDSLEDKPEHQRVWAGDGLHEDKDNLRITAQYLLGCNSFVDSQIGRLLEQVRRLAPEAMIIYTSDHGDFLHSHSLSGKGPAAYDEITHIPLLIRSPKVQGGKVNPHPVSHINLVPTILDYLGLPIPKLLEGRSILPMVEDTECSVNEAVFLEFTRYEVDHDGFGGFQPLRTVFDGRYKLTINLLTSDELYDLQEDSAEMVNLINDETTAVLRDKLHDKLLEWMNVTRDPFRGYYWERRPWRLDAREASWDYTGYTRQRENEEYEPRQLDYSTGLEIKEAQRPKPSTKTR